MQTVEEKPWVIKYVGEQTPELCMAAVQNDGMALEYVRDKHLNYVWRQYKIISEQFVL